MFNEVGLVIKDFDNPSKEVVTSVHDLICLLTKHFSKVSLDQSKSTFASGLDVPRPPPIFISIVIYFNDINLLPYQYS